VCYISKSTTLVNCIPVLDYNYIYNILYCSIKLFLKIMQRYGPNANMYKLTARTPFKVYVSFFIQIINMIYQIQT
jgi:hypothetical protein